MAVNAVVTGTGPLFLLAAGKAHLHVEHNDDDALIQAQIDAAVLSVLSWCDLKLVPQGAEPVFEAAAKLMLGDLYANREAVVAGQSFGVNPTVERLLQPYRRYCV